MVVSWVQLTRILSESSSFLSAFLCIFWETSSITRPTPNLLSSGETASKSRPVRFVQAPKEGHLLTSSKPFDNHGIFLFARLRGCPQRECSISYNGVHNGRVKELFRNLYTIGSRSANLQPESVVKRMSQPHRKRAYRLEYTARFG